jgi:hypothetical protein
MENCRPDVLAKFFALGAARAAGAQRVEKTLATVRRENFILLLWLIRHPEAWRKSS